MKSCLNSSTCKRMALLMLLALVCLALTACYMEPDRVVDNQNGLNAGDNQTFDTVITPTPTVTATPTVAPTSNQVDWSSWDFGADTATNPPSNVSPTQGIVTVTAVPNISTVTVAPNVSSATAKPTTAPTASSALEVLRLGSSGANVKRLQQQLKNLGYLTGSVDGDFGQATELAVKNFQLNNGLTADGVAGKRTQEKLYGGSAKKFTSSSSTVKPSTSTSSSSSSSSKKNNTSSSSSSNTSTAYTNGKTDTYLQLGSSGSQVKILQNRLIVLGYLTGTADGKFGETTEKAVKSFQDRNGLYADGVAGPTTLTKLYSSSAKKASSAVAHLGSLREGAEGDSVRALQKNLRTLGYYTGSVDGSYGSGTMAAVTAFQSAYGLKADGIAGTATLNAIENAVGGGSSSSSSSGSSTNPEVYGKTASSTGYKTMSTASNSSGSDVTTLQSLLRSTGYYTGTVDGSYGSGTEKAVENYQRAMGLRVTGMAGPTTQRLLYGSTKESGSYSKLEPGDSGSSVKRLQYALYELLYYDDSITGSYDNATENAVRLFQEVNGLYVDGIAGKDTQRRLFSSNAVPNNM